MFTMHPGNSNPHNQAGERVLLQQPMLSESSLVKIIKATTPETPQISFAFQRPTSFTFSLPALSNGYPTPTLRPAGGNNPLNSQITTSEARTSIPVKEPMDLDEFLRLENSIPVPPSMLDALGALSALGWGRPGPIAAGAADEVDPFASFGPQELENFIWSW